MAFLGKPDGAVEPPRPGDVRRRQARDRPHAGEGPPPALPAPARALRRDERHRRRGQAGARGHAASAWPTSRRSASSASRTSSRPGCPYIGPYNVNSIAEPGARHVPRARLLLQPLPGRAARPRGRRDDLHAPGRARVPPGAPPLLRRLLRGGARARPPTRWRSSSASSAPTPRTSGTATSTGRRTPTTASTRSTCGTGARTRCEHLGDVIFVGRRPARPASGWASGAPTTMQDALEMAEQVVGPRPVDHPLPLPAAVLRRGGVRRSPSDGCRRSAPRAREPAGVAHRRRGRGRRSIARATSTGCAAARGQPGARGAQQTLLFPATRFVARPTVRGAERSALHRRSRRSSRPTTRATSTRRSSCSRCRTPGARAPSSARPGPLLPPAGAIADHRAVDQHVPVRPRRRPAPRPRRGRRAPARRAATSCSSPRAPRGAARRLPRTASPARARRDVADRPRPRRRAPRSSCPRAAASPSAGTARSRSGARCTRIARRSRATSPRA